MTKGGNTKVSKNFRKKVEEVLKEEVEVKSIAPQITRDTRITNALTDNVLQVIKLTPNIAQGDGQGDRVGNRVTTKRAMLYLSAHMFQVTSTPQVDPPKYLDIYIYKYKRSNNQDAILLQNFLQYGNTSVAYDSLAIPESGSFDINRDKFTLKKHIRKLMWNPTEVNTNARATRALNAIQMKLDITKYLKKELVFDDDFSNTVSNDNLYISCVYTNNDDQAYANNLVAGEYDVSFFYDYTDL